VGWNAITEGPWDVVLGVAVIAGIAGIRLLRRPRLYRVTVILAGIALVAQITLIVFGFAYLVSSSAFGEGVDLGTAPTWSSIAFAIPLAMLAYTGLETVANLAAEAREPGKNLPRSLFGGIGAAVVVSVAIGIVAISAFPGGRELGTKWLGAPLVGIAAALKDAGLSPAVADAVKVFMGVSGVLVLGMVVTTSISGAGRLAYSLGQRDMLPHVFARLSRRTLISPVAILSVAGIAIALLITTEALGSVRSLAGLYSFGVLLTFTAAQVAVVKLRFSEPDLERPFRVPVNVRIRGTPVPLAALVGIPLTLAIWVGTLATHTSVRIAGPVWLLLGALVFTLVRRSRGAAMTERVDAPVADLVEPHEEGIYRHILVPMKLGPIGEEVLATAIKLAEEQSAKLTALHVIKVPLDQALDAPLHPEEEQAAASVEEATEIAGEHGVTVDGRIVRARALGPAIVEEAQASGADLILMGSAPRWRRQSRFFSPTVDYVLRKAPCEVMVVAYPQGVLEAESVG
jgi:APA family basic amino acid/polyamine antiporter